MFDGSPARVCPSPIVQSLAATSATTILLPCAKTAMCCASDANGIPIAEPLSVPSSSKMIRSEGRLGAIVMDPFGAATPARVSSQPASSVSASGTAKANRPATPSTAKPSARVAPAPPSRSGTQASGRPASQSACQNGAFQAPLSSRLMVCGSARSAKIRAADSVTIWSLSFVTMVFFVSLRPFAKSHGRPQLRIYGAAVGFQRGVQGSLPPPEGIARHSLAASGK